jgi:hypothetical protein
MATLYFCAKCGTRTDSNGVVHTDSAGAQSTPDHVGYDPQNAAQRKGMPVSYETPGVKTR